MPFGMFYSMFYFVTLTHDEHVFIAS